MWKLHKVNVATKYYTNSDIEEHRVARNAEIQWDIFKALKASQLPDNIDKLLSEVEKPGQLHGKLSNKEFNTLFDYLGVALWIDEVANETREWYAQIIELDSDGISKPNCWYHPKQALFFAHMRANGIGKEVIKLFQKKLKGYWLSVPNSHESIPMISDDYLKLILNSELGIFQTLNFITYYFGSNKRCYQLFNDLDKNLAEKVIGLLKHVSIQKYFHQINKIEADQLLLLWEKYIQRLIDMSDKERDSFFKQKKDDLLPRLCVEDDREFNKTLNWIQY